MSEIPENTQKSDIFNFNTTIKESPATSENVKSDISTENTQEKAEIPVLIGELINFGFISAGFAVGGEKLSNKVKLNKEEIEAVNTALKPLWLKLLEWLGITADVLALVVVLGPLFLTRILIIIQYQRRKNRAKKARGKVVKNVTGEKKNEIEPQTKENN